LPFAAKFIVKAGLALPVTFHSFNGLRHLVWDLGRAMTNQQVIKTGWSVVGLSVTAAVLLALL
jgi:succinate dehydrogenase (ubiquinone) cytochrome b560 subunit